MAATIPGGKGTMSEIPGVGHGLHIEDLEATLSALRGFLAT